MKLQVIAAQDAIIRNQNSRIDELAKANQHLASGAERLAAELRRLLVLAPALDPDHPYESGQVIAFRYHGGPSRPWSVPEEYPLTAEILSGTNAQAADGR